MAFYVVGYLMAVFCRGFFCVGWGIGHPLDQHVGRNMDFWALMVVVMVGCLAWLGVRTAPSYSWVKPAVRLGLCWVALPGALASKP